MVKLKTPVAQMVYCQEVSCQLGYGLQRADRLRCRQGRFGIVATRQQRVGDTVVFAVLTDDQRAGWVQARQRAVPYAALIRKTNGVAGVEVHPLLLTHPVDRSTPTARDPD